MFAKRAPDVSTLDRAGSALREAGRRSALARQPAPETARAPAMKLLLAELSSLPRMFGRVKRSPSVAPAVKPCPVMLLPGFGAHPARMKPMLDALNAAGHSARDWGLGFNLGPTPQNFAHLLAQVARIAREEGQPVALVGWSLGGVFAREIARMRPDAVAKVITMGSPFSGDPRSNNGWRAYQLITGHPVEAPPVPCEFAAKPPVPTIALWSPRDGVVSPRSAAGWPGERDRAIALRCNHLAFPRAPEAIAAVLAELDRDD